MIIRNNIPFIISNRLEKIIKDFAEVIVFHIRVD